MSQPDPGLIFDTLNAHQRSAALRTAMELDLFTAVGEGNHTASALATRLSIAPRGARILCDSLTISGFLSKTESHYELSPTSAIFLDRRSPAAMTSMVHFLSNSKILASSADFTNIVRKGGTTLPEPLAGEQVREWVTFAETMAPMMHGAAEFIAEVAASHTGPVKVLDVAASHGVFGLAIARRNPQATVYAQDFPTVLEVTRRNVEAVDASGQFRYLPGSIFEIELPSDFDVILLTNLLHHFDESGCVAILKRLHAALRPGGLLLDLEMVPNEDRVSPPVPAAFALMMLCNTPAGDAYTFAEHRHFLALAGFDVAAHPPELHQVPKSPQQLVVARK